MSESSPVQGPVDARTVLLAAVEQLRPKQWAKNGLLFAALLFSGQFTDLGMVVRAGLGFVAYCMIASAGYVLNDYLDRESDRAHPKKCHRPQASGRLPLGVALVELGLLAAGGVAISLLLSPWFLLIAGLYLATTLSYSYKLKHMVILDILILASHYVWRALAGAAAIEVHVSPWFFTATAFGALFIGLSKRHAELRLVGQGGATRRILEAYSEPLIHQLQAIVTSGLVMTYALYAFQGPTPWMLLTLPFVLYVIFRWIYLVERRGEGGAPEDTLFGDKPLLISVGLYVVTTMVILYLDSQELLSDGFTW